MKFNGLSADEIIASRQKFGKNILPEKEKYSPWQTFFAQFQSPLIYILIVVAAISVYFKEINDAILVLGVVLLDVGMGFWQENQAQQTLSALKKIVSHKALVIRDKQRKEIAVENVVVGDLVVLGAGDTVPADGKLLEGINLLVNEAILTGEQEALPKSEQGDKKLFMGTTVLSGRGVMEVGNIGVKTEMGKIGASLVEIEQSQTPLQRQMADFSHNLLYIIFAVCGAILIFGLVAKEPIVGMVRLSIILAVAAIPEGLPVAITLILALGMRRILKKKGLVKKLVSIETLGVTSVICTDKTGTLTEGKMQVKRQHFTDPHEARYCMILANDQKTNLEISLNEFAGSQNGLAPQEVYESAPRSFEESFDSQKKYMLTVNHLNGLDRVFAKGAPEIVLAWCPMPDEERQKWEEEIFAWASSGLRVLGFVTKEAGTPLGKYDYKWLGIVGIEDPIRPTAKKSIQDAQAMGIKVKIVTGDYKETAAHIARNLGLAFIESQIIAGSQIEKMGEEELQLAASQGVIFARVTPLQKLRIVKALQSQGEIVAMTGDGVNDAPALKQANIGLVVDNATDVAKSAGDLILLDSNFQTIVDACEEGRLIFANIKKVVGYTLSNSFAEIFLIFGAMLLKLPAPLTIVQILWIHFICDGPLDLLLGFEEKEKSLRDYSPQELQREKILDGSMKFLIFGISFVTGILALMLFIHYYREGELALARSVAFATLAIVDLIYVFSFKNLKRLLINTENFFANKYLIWGVAGGFAMVLIALYFPPAVHVLETVKLTSVEWAEIIFIALLDLILVEAVKAANIGRHKNLSKHENLS